MITAEQYLEERAKTLGASGLRRRASGVVITGFAGVTSLGDAKKTFEWMLNGESGVQDFPANNFRTNVASPAQFNPRDHFNEDELKGVSLVSAMSTAYAREVALNAGLLDSDGKRLNSETNKNRVATCISSGIGPTPNIIRIYQRLIEGTEGITDEEQRNEIIRQNSKKVKPLWGIEMFPEEINANPAMALKCSGWGINTVEACATSLSNAVEGVRLIMDGYADVVIAGGFEETLADPNHTEVHRVTIAPFAAMRASATGRLGAAGASRPFDADRDGLVLGSGGGVVVIESREFAEKRGVPIIAEVVGYSKSMDGNDQTALDPKNVGRTILESLKDPRTGIFYRPDVIFTHSTSTKEGDQLEGNALYIAFGELLKDIPLAAIKSNIGHLLGGAGIWNLIALLQAMQYGKVPHILNLENPRLNVLKPNEPDDEAIKYMDFVRDHPREMIINSGLALAYAFGGYNASMLVRKYVTGSLTAGF